MSAASGVDLDAICSTTLDCHSNLSRIPGVDDGGRFVVKAEDAKTSVGYR